MEQARPNLQRSTVQIKESREHKKSKKKYTPRQWFTLAVIGSFHFSSAICISLQAPFYPQEAELKGATATEYGLVFGSFELMAFLTSPIIGKYLHSMGVKFCLNFGIFVAAISAISFGLLDLVPGHDLFIGLSFIIRMTESLGSTLALVAAFSITAAVFPDNVATTFASMEVFYGLGYIVGPTLGGVLFAYGGYILPFMVNGFAMLVVGVFTFFTLPAYKQDPSEADNNATMMQILKVPSIMLDSLCIVGASMSMGFYASTLEPHIREFNLPTVSNALMFIISGGTYAACAPFVGKLCDKYIYPKKVIATGSLLIIFSYFLVGPFPLLPIPKTLELTIIGLMIHGFGIAALMAPTFIDSIRAAVEMGYADDIKTYGLISGLWSSSFALGAFVGPSVSGLLFDLVGFSYGTLYIIGIHCLLFTGTICFIMLEEKHTAPYKRIRIISGCETATSDDDFFLPSHSLVGKNPPSKTQYGAIGGKEFI